MILSLVVIPVLLLVLGSPIFVVLLAAGVVTLAFYMNVPVAAIHQNLFGSINSSGLLAIPFFIFAGELMSRGSISLRLVEFVRSMVVRVPGSLGVTTVGTATVFGAISGSSAAAVASVGKIMHPAMSKENYPPSFSAGMITSVNAIGVIIPPSIPLIVYGAASETSIPRLYAAGVLPGLLLAAMLTVFIMWRAKRSGYGSREDFSWRRVFHSTGRAMWALGAPLIVLGGIYGGIFSPTEAAAVGSVYALAVTLIIYRELGWRDILGAAKNTAVFTSQVLVIVSAAGLLSWVLTVNQIPQDIVTWVVGYEINTWQFFLAVNVLLLLVGCVLDPLSAILLLTPILIPVVDALGIDKVHFGIVVALNLSIGLFTPPFGINIFIAQSAMGMQAKDIYRGIVPFFWVFIAALVLITFLPSISLSSMNFFLF